MRTASMRGAVGRRSARLTAGVIVCFLLASPTVQATPIVHTITGAHVDIDVKLNGVVIGSATSAITGDSITIDSAALTIDAIRLEIASTTIMLSESFGGYDEITVESAILEGDPGFATSSAIGVPSLFTAVAGPLTVTGSWGATDSGGINPDTSGNPITFPVVAIIAVTNTDPLVQIDSVTINSLDGTPFGEPGKNLTIVANYVVTGSVGGGGGLPEPGTGLLFALGLVLLATRRAPRSTRGNASRA